MTTEANTTQADAGRHERGVRRVFSRLQADGRIPAHTVCPYKQDCGIAEAGFRSVKNLESREMDVTYTKEELDEFRDLVEAGESIQQLERIRSRLEMPKFIERVGRDKCDAMFEVLKDEYKQKPGRRA